MAALTLKQARAALARRGMVIAFDRDLDEYRVNFKGGREATAAYTSDLDDAIGTALYEAERRDTFEAYEELAIFDRGGAAARLVEALDRDEIAARSHRTQG